MTIIAIAAVVTAVSIVIMTIVVIATAIEIRKTAIAARIFMDHAETEIKPVLLELHETVNNLKIITDGAADKIEDMKTFIAAAGDTGRMVGNVTGLVSRSSLWMTGLKAAGKFVLTRYIKKRG